MVALLDKSPLPPKTALRARGDILHLVAPVRARHNSSNRTEFHRFTYVTVFRLESCAKDPIGYEGGDTNVYAFVYSQPTRMLDPSGLWGWGSIDFVLHYYYGGGRPVDLADIGLLDPLIALHRAEVDNLINGLMKGSTPTCASAGSFSSSSTGSDKIDFLNVPSCADRLGRMFTGPIDPLFSIGCSGATYSFSINTSYTCEVCCDGSLRRTSMYQVGTFDFSIRDLFTNPGDDSGPYSGSGPARDLIACLDGCRAAHLARLAACRSLRAGRRGCENGANASNRACTSRCRTKHPTKDYPGGTPYEINGSWSETVIATDSNPCPTASFTTR
jgi:hypothetical protein